MQHAQRYWFTKRDPLLPGLAVLMTVSIFLFDTLTDLEIAVAALYVFVILLSVSFAQGRGVLIICGTCIVLTIASFLLTRSGAPVSSAINYIISIAAIAATTYLVLRIETARVAVYEARAQLAHVARVTTLEAF